MPYCHSNLPCFIHAFEHDLIQVCLQEARVAMVFLPILDAMDDVYAGRRLLKPPVQMFLDMFFFSKRVVMVLRVDYFRCGF